MVIIKINAVWCPACLVMNKVVKKVNERYPDIEIVSYDYDMDADIVKNYNVGNVLPVFIFMDNDKEVKRLTGEIDEASFIKEIENW